MQPSTVEVLPFSDQHLFQNLGHDLLGPAAVADHGRVKYLVGYLQHLGAKTLVVEKEYTDADYLDDFAAYYVKCFQPYQRRCRRLHFFARDFTQEDFVRLIRGEMAAEKHAYTESYLGFVVARPLPDAIIGRTILRTYDDDKGRRHYPCTKDYSANLFGLGLSVQSLAFQEQDSVLAACATVALWCAFHKTAELFGTPAPTPATITQVANHVIHPARPVPSHGLNVQQVCSSIRHIGLEPEVVEVRKNVPLVSLIYGHLQMGLPVLLMVEVEGAGLHAITLTGYSVRNQQVTPTEVAAGEQCIPLIGLRIDELYGHDDQIGPFAHIHVRPSATVGTNVYPVVFDGSWVNPTTGKCLALYPKIVVVPVYHKIRVTFLDVQKWLTRLTFLLQVLKDPAGTPLALEWDLYLTTTNAYKTTLQQTTLARDRLEELLFLQHPRFIWRAVLSVSGKTALELLTDATDMARSFPIYRGIWWDANVHAALSTLLNAPQLQSVLTPALTQRFHEFLRQIPGP